MNSSHKESFSIKSYDIDCNGNLKLFAFMNYAQEMANIHADALGFGYDNLMGKNTVWVLSRVHVKVLRHPKWRETIQMETWHKGDESIFGLRDFFVCDDNGEPLILATSSWVIIDAVSRRILRIRNVVGDDNGTAYQRDAIKKSAERLTSPDGMVLVGEKRVSYSDIDINQHTNNAKYIEWAVDFIDSDMLEQKPVKEFTVNFNHESKLHQKIDIFRKDTGDMVFIEGRLGDTNVFQIRFMF